MMERVRVYAPSILHFGNSLALLGFAMSDVLHLRALNLVASACGFVFNLTHVPFLKRGAAWNAVFILVNGAMTMILLAERNQEVTFSREELEIFGKHFLPYGVTPLQFRKVLDLAKWVDVPQGKVIAEEGGIESHLLLIVGGEVEAQVAHGVTVDSFSMDPRDLGFKGYWLGEPNFLDPSHNKGHLATYEAKTPVKMLEWDNDKLHALFKKDADLNRSIGRVVSGSLVAKVMKFAEEATQNSLEAYEHVLRAVVADDEIAPAEKALVREYRENYNITDAAHKAALGKLGWTPEQFEDGSRKPQTKQMAAAASKLEATLKRYNTVSQQQQAAAPPTSATALP